MTQDRAQAGEADRRLAQAAAAGDPQARQQMVGRLYDRVRTTVRYLAGGHRDVDDLVQISLVEILRSAKGFKGEGRLESWADQITVRTSLRALKKRRRRDAIVAPQEDGHADPIPARPETVQAGTGIEDAAARKQLAERLACALQRLHADRRTVVLLHWVYGYTVKEIAELTGARVNTVKGRLRYGKRDLRELVLDDPVLCDWRPGGFE